MDEFDYIVIGGGSAGCIVAARLSESGAYRVALLEAGGKDDNFWIKTPLGYGKLYDDPRYNWMYEGLPEPGLLDAKCFLPRGKVLGGTGSINGMVYLRGQSQDFDHWRALGNVGWGYDDVLPYFKKAEGNQRGADRFHGDGGPLAVSDTPRNELADAFITAGTQAGFVRNTDFNGATQDGFGYHQATISHGRRSSTATGHLRSVAAKANLTIITGVEVSRIRFNGAVANGVEYMRDGVVQSLTARREIVVCAGVFNAPKLLQLSGVGPGKLLGELGIPVISNLPAVGENLQDHLAVPTTYRCTRPITLNDIVNNPARRYAAGLAYLLLRRGVMASNAVYAGACIRTNGSLPTPDIMLNLTQWSRQASGRAKQGMRLDPFPGFTILMGLLHPDSRGTVRIRHPDPKAAPEIRFNFFLSERDRQTCVAGLRLIRGLIGMPALKPYVAEEMAPNADCASDADLEAFCRQRGRSLNHATSTCRMADDGVVDARLRVHGVAGLRVIDASIMPRVVAANPNAAVVMIGEKGAAMILEDAKA